MAGRYDGGGSCSSRATGQCGCCTRGYLYGCSGSCGESRTSVAQGACSSRATGSCGCCNSGLSLFYVWYFKTCVFVTDCPELPVHGVPPSFILSPSSNADIIVTQVFSTAALARAAEVRQGPMVGSRWAAVLAAELAAAAQIPWQCWELSWDLEALQRPWDWNKHLQPKLQTYSLMQR